MNPFGFQSKFGKSRTSLILEKTTTYDVSRIERHVLPSLLLSPFETLLLQVITLNICLLPFFSVACPLTSD